MKKTMMLFPMRRISCVLVSVVLVLGFATVAAACPTCSLGLAENDPTHGGMVAGYFYSILFMMSMPYVLLGSFGGYAYFAMRRARVEEQDSGVADETTDIA